MKKDWVKEAFMGGVISPAEIAAELTQAAIDRGENASVLVIKEDDFRTMIVFFVSVMKEAIDIMDKAAHGLDEEAKIAFAGNALLLCGLLAANGSAQRFDIAETQEMLINTLLTFFPNGFGFPKGYGKPGEIIEEGLAFIRRDMPR